MILIFGLVMAGILGFIVAGGDPLNPHRKMTFIDAWIEAYLLQ